MADNAPYAWDVRQRFVGEIDVPEGEYYAQCTTYASLDRLADQEPLLQESKRRFVLFPIQYHDVSMTPLGIHRDSPPA